ncbi:YbaY family lipoprotein [uncultured Pseudodesulfovibrio sp.]|uniref:YbaY family lipoprotein n=1 Tax=uncultured Pseudodesulfovibrio sp. TaxID=2035858 RepID=UPI0029C8DD60|nr:YbaY family lipoprotein [uncultured Pseudodesulfovibrio sp.]
MQNTRPTFPALLAAALILALLGGCTAASTRQNTATAPEPSANARATLKVSVSYRERMLLPPGCTLFLELENISQLNPKDNEITSAFIPVKAAPPFKVVMKYDPDKIVKQLHYAVTARIQLNGQVLFSGSARIDPLSWPEDTPLSITVTMVKR